MCVLRVYGPSFDPVAYLAAESDLEPIRIYVPGEPIFEKRLARYGIADCGFHVDVSSRPNSDLQGQIQDALRFLQRHGEELCQLSQREEVTSVHLDFAAEADPAQSHVIIWRGGFPNSLLEAAGSAGVDVYVSLYFTPDRGADVRDDG